MIRGFMIMCAVVDVYLTSESINVYIGTGYVGVGAICPWVFTSLEVRNSLWFKGVSSTHVYQTLP